MKTRILFTILTATLLITSCSDDDKPSNKPPGTFSVNPEVNANSVTLSWNEAVDPEKGVINYTIELENNTVATELTETSYLISDLRYEKEYSGKVIAKDRKGAATEIPFTFTTDFLFLKSYEDNSDEFFLSYNDEGQLINIETSSSDHNQLVRNGEGNLIGLGVVTYSYSSGGLVSSLNDGKGEGELVYDSKDRIVRMTSDYNFTPTSRDRVTRKHTYNDLNQLIQVDEETYDFSSGNSIFSRIKLQYDSKGNVVQVKDQYSFDDVTYSEGTTVTYTYDDKKNPWYTILMEQTNFNPLFVESQNLLHATVSLGNSVVYRTALMSKNNVLSERRQSGSAYSQLDYDYTYNEDGYPTTAEITHEYSDSPSGTSYKRWHY